MTTASVNTSRLGIFCMLGGMMCISVNDMLVKSLSAGYPLHELIFVRSVVAFFITLILLKMEGGWRLLNTGRWALHITRAVFILIANSVFFAALASIPLATATSLYFVAPFFVTLLSIPILGEQVGLRRFAAIGVGFLGVLVMMAPQFSESDKALGWLAVLPMIGAAFYAAMSVLTRKLGQTSRASALALQLHISFISISALFYLIAGDGRFVTEDSNPSLRFLLRAWIWPTPDDWILILGLGLVSACIGYLMTQAYRLSRASVVAPFEYVLLIFSLFWGWVIFGEWPQFSVLIGAMIVIASGVYVFVREGRVAKAAKSPPSRL